MKQNPATLSHEAPLSFSNGWVLSKWLDLALTWGVIALSAVLFFLFEFENTEAWEFIHFYGIWVAIDVSHIFATISPLRIRWQKGLISRQKLVLVPLLASAACLLSIWFSHQFFITVLAFAAIFHIYAQQYGLLMVSRKVNRDEDSRHWDSLAIWTIMLFPLVWWLSEYQPIEQEYYHANDFFFQLPAGLADSLHFIHWGVIAAYLIVVMKTVVKSKKINLAKYSFLLANWAWLYLGIVVFESSIYFWTCLVITHGGFYTLLVLKEQSRFLNPPPTQRKKWLSFFAIVAMSATWFVFFRLLEGWLEPAHYLMGLGWIHLVTHYSFDAFIWKRHHSPSYGLT